jgi:hypothetical protein
MLHDVAMVADISREARVWTPIVIAVAALVFTIGSFWWMNARTGRLIVTAPRSYAITTQENRLILLLPLVFYNSGPVPYVVRDLRVRFGDEPSGPATAFHRVRGGVSPTHHPTPELSAAFPVPGRTAVRMFCEFERIPVGRAMDSRAHPLVVDGLTDKNDQWRPLTGFDLHVSMNAEVGMSSQFISYFNEG